MPALGRSTQCCRVFSILSVHAIWNAGSASLVISRALSTTLDRQIDSAAPVRSSRSRIIQAEEVVVDVPATRGGRVEQERLRTGRGAAKMRALVGTTGARVCVCAICGALRVWRGRGPAKTSTGWCRRRPVRRRRRRQLSAAAARPVWLGSGSCDAAGALGPAAGGRRRPPQVEGRGGARAGGGRGRGAQGQGGGGQTTGAGAGYPRFPVTRLGCRC